MGKDLEQSKRELKTHLSEFLVNQGVQSSKGKKDFFYCIYPDHKDNNPSMGVMTNDNNEQVYHCMGCHRSGDIFTANSILNGKPLFGYEFIIENLKPLTEMYGIDFTPRPMTEDDIDKMNLKAALSLVKMQLLSNGKYGQTDEKVLEFCNHKQITKDNMQHYLLGAVRSWKSFYDELISRGATPDIIRRLGIEPTIFNENNLIFMIDDEYGNLIGFAARNCRYDTSNPDSVKYLNVRNTDLYNKSKVLYNLHRVVKKKYTAKTNSLYIVEGYTDAITLDKFDIKAAGLAGTAFTNDHIAILQKVGITDIVLLLDGDKEGVNAADRIVEIMKGIRNFRVRIALLPENEDPDTFVLNNGVEGLMGLPHVSTFEWRLKQLQDKTNLDGHELAAQMIPLIVNERSHISRESMCKQVSTMCDIPIESIRKEVLLISNDKEIRTKEEQDAIIDNHIKLLKKNPTDALVILRNTERSVKGLMDKNMASIYDEVECLEGIRNVQIQQEQTDFVSSLYLWKMPHLENAIDGNISDKLLLLNGQPNAGKTSFLINMMNNILRSGEEDLDYGIFANPDRVNNVTILFHTIDDSRGEVIPRFVSMIAHEAHRGVTINNMDAPHKYLGHDTQAFINARQFGYDMMYSWIQQGRLIIKDASHGKNLSSASIMIESLKAKFPDRKFIYVLDNMYKLSDFSNLDEHVRTERLCQALKDLATIDRITVISTAEYRKGDSKVASYQALNEMMKGGKGMEYDANWIGHLLNDLHTVGKDTSDMYFSEYSNDEALITDDEKLPVITLRVAKNKITGTKTDLHYLFIPHRAVYMELNEYTLNMIPQRLRERIGNKYM